MWNGLWNGLGNFIGLDKCQYLAFKLKALVFKWPLRNVYTIITIVQLYKLKPQSQIIQATQTQVILYIEGQNYNYYCKLKVANSLITIDRL